MVSSPLVAPSKKTKKFIPKIKRKKKSYVKVWDNLLDKMVSFSGNKRCPRLKRENQRYIEDDDVSTLI